MPEDAANVVPLRVAGEFPAPLEELVEQAIRIAAGLITISVDTLSEAVAQTLSGPGPRGPVADQRTDRAVAIPMLTGAAIGVAVGVARWGARAATTLVRTGEIVLSPVTTSVPFRDAMRRLGSEVDALDARWREERPREEAAAEAFARLLVPQVVDAALDQIDLNDLVAQRVDVGRIVDQVDLDAVIERVDLNAVIARVDLDALVEGIDLDRILQRVDLAAIVDRLPLDDVIAKIDIDDIIARVDLDRVVERIDLDAVASRLDVGAVVERLDLGSIAQEVIDEIDLPEIIRESMGSMTTETVGGIRVQSMNADRAISRLIDRVLQRDASARDETEPPSEEPT